MVTNRKPWSPEKRAALSAKMKVRMADPAVRDRVSKATKLGMMAATGELLDLRRLQDAWRLARPSARVRFLNDLFSPVCSASVPQPDDRNEAQ